MKLKWDISCPTYIEFLPFIYDILDSSLQEDIGKGNQVRNDFRFTSGSTSDLVLYRVGRFKFTHSWGKDEDSPISA